MPMKKELYPDNWNEIAEEVKKAADYKCKLCNSKSIPKKILTVHHIDSNPKNNTEKNLIALCQKCHLSAQAKPSILDILNPAQLKFSFLQT
jgi:5-methylcytosine-specific restriction endonuclease McrA